MTVTIFTVGRASCSILICKTRKRSCFTRGSNINNEYILWFLARWYIIVYGRVADFRQRWASLKFYIRIVINSLREKKTCIIFMYCMPRTIVALINHLRIIRKNICINSTISVIWISLVGNSKPRMRFKWIILGFP